MTLGLLVLVSVTGNECVISVTVSPTVPATAEVTVKFPCPFCTRNVVWLGPPFICAPDPPELTLTETESDETGFWLQSRMMTANVTVDPAAADTGDAGYTSEYQGLGSPPTVVQWALPALLLPKVMLGL